MIELIVAEKPSVARDLARALNVEQRRDGFYGSPNLWVTWCLGHMAQLCEPQVYNPRWRAWHLATLPMIPKTFELTPIPSHLTQWQKILNLLQNKQVTCVINACDAGREGELIFRFVMQMADCHKPVKRLWLHALTDTAIRHGMQKLAPASDFDALAAAARCRAEADWLVGMNATRAMTVRHRPRHGQGALFPVGRVQTPTLSLVVLREQDIENFSPTPFWQIRASFVHPNGAYTGTYTPTGIEPLGHKPPAHTFSWPTDRILDKQHAQALCQSLQKQQYGTVTDVEYKEQQERCPMLYDLTSLQRRANVQYQLTAQQTLDAAQSLYERHKVLTYPRTDSNCLPQEMAQALPVILKRLQNSDYVSWITPLLSSQARIDGRMINDAEVSDHHAIIPTGRVVAQAALSTYEQQIFDLVLRRFIAAFYPPARFATSRIDTALGVHIFRSRGKTLLAPGWRAVDPPVEVSFKHQKAQASQLPPTLPHLPRHSQVELQQVKLVEGKTTAPARYTEASLLGAMERAGRQLEDAELKRALKDEGLGTPATRANIIETLKKRQLLQLHGKVLQPTEHGRQLVEKIPVASLKSAQLTGEWEARLSQIAQGRLSRPAFMQQVETFTTKLVQDICEQTLQPAAQTECLVSPDQKVPAPKRLPRRKKARNTQPERTKQATKRSSSQPQGGEQLNLACPLCQSPITHHPKVYSCARTFQCTFVIFTKIAQRPISPQEVRQLVCDKQTPILSGFSDRNGKPFQAALRLNAQGRVDFVFSGTSH